MDMHFLDDVSLPGHGKISGAFWSPDRRILAVASVFRLLTEPPARAAYGGHRLRYRVSLYRPPSRRPIAVFDDARLPINDVTFHPTKTVVAIGAGTYDGGYMFKGQLVLWDWTLAPAQSIRAIPEVKRLRFVDCGDDIDAIVRPWDDGAARSHLRDPSDAFYRISLKQVFAGEWGSRYERIVHDQIVDQQPLTGREVENAPDFCEQPAKDPVGEIARAFGLSDFRQRSPIWDVALTGTDEVSVVHDDCLLEVFDRQGERKGSFNGRGHGVQIFRAREPLIHCVYTDENADNWWRSSNSVLMRLRNGRLDECFSLVGRYTFSVSESGNVLGRCDRSFQAHRESAAIDVIVSSDLEEIEKYDLGHYDVFNHYIRVDAAPYLFVVQGNPATSHEGKYLCTVTGDGRVQRLWPLLTDIGGKSSHAMECCYCYISDGQGPGVIVSGRHHNPSPRASYDGFIYRRQLDGRELWRHATTASAAAIEVVPISGLVVVAFLDGKLAVFNGDSGAVAHWQTFKLDGHVSIIISLDVDSERVAFGTIDGRCAVVSLSAFLSESPG